MRRQRAAGMLHCSACGGFYAGRRGLRDHQQIKHRTSYEEATEAVQAARCKHEPRPLWFPLHEYLPPYTKPYMN